MLQPLRGMIGWMASDLERGDDWVQQAVGRVA